MRESHQLTLQWMAEASPASSPSAPPACCTKACMDCKGNLVLGLSEFGSAAVESCDFPESKPLRCTGRVQFASVPMRSVQLAGVEQAT